MTLLFPSVCTIVKVKKKRKIESKRGFKKLGELLGNVATRNIMFSMWVGDLWPLDVQRSEKRSACIGLNICTVCVSSREDHLHRNQCSASDGPAWLGGPGQEVHLRFLSAAGQRALPRQEAAAWGWVRRCHWFWFFCFALFCFFRSWKIIGSPSLCQLRHGYQSFSCRYKKMELNAELQ